LDPSAIDRAIYEYLLRSGRRDVADILREEAELSEPSELTEKIIEMDEVVSTLRNEDADAALRWCAAHEQHLSSRSSNVDLLIFRSKFIHYLEDGASQDAIRFARAHVSLIFSRHPSGMTFPTLLTPFSKNRNVAPHGPAVIYEKRPYEAPKCKGWCYRCRRHRRIRTGSLRRAWPPSRRQSRHLVFKNTNLLLIKICQSNVCSQS
jgi:hypothetical protein